MSRNVCIDAGPISLYYQKNPPDNVLDLIEKVKMAHLTAYIPSCILLEVFKHLCIASGKDYAERCLRSFQSAVRPTICDLTSSLILRAGSLKCQYRKILSYNDCVVIALALEKGAELHTTEKNLPHLQGLTVVPYSFD